MELGLRSVGVSTKVVGMGVANAGVILRSEVTDLVNVTARLLGIIKGWSTNDIHVMGDHWIHGNANSTSGGRSALEEFIASDGIFLDSGTQLNP